MDGKKQGKFARRLGIAIHRVSWMYLFAILGFWIFLRVAGDQWWLGTLFLFGPLWVSSLPVLCLVPLSLIFHRRSLILLLVGGAVSVFPVMGFCVPWRAWLQGASHDQHLRILTCNVNGKSLSDDSLVQLMTECKPDVVVLQEWYAHSRQPLLSDGTWYLRQDDELLIASRFPIAQSQDLKDPAWNNWGGSAMRYDLSMPTGMLHLFNVHLASPHRPFEAVMEGHSSASEFLEKHLFIRSLQSLRVSTAAQSIGNDAVLAGDFNTPCEGSIYRQYWSQFSDAFSVAGFGIGHTYFAEGAAVRIDHVFLGAGWKCRSCRVGPSVGSPHRPLIADLERRATTR